jgi:hypothetical protein
MNPITNYFNAERAESLLFIALGLVALGLAWWAWRVKRTPFWRGAAWPLALVAAIQLVVGGTVWQRSPQDMARAQQSVAQDKPRIASELSCRAARAGLSGLVAVAPHSFPAFPCAPLGADVSPDRGLAALSLVKSTQLRQNQFGFA